MGIGGIHPSGSGVLSGEHPQVPVQRCVNLDVQKQWAGLASNLSTKEVPGLGRDHPPGPAQL